MRVIGIVTVSMMLTSSAALGADDAQRAIISYIKTHSKPGERLVLSHLFNEVFTSDEERVALEKLTSAFFSIPLFLVQFEQTEGRLPSLTEIADNFAFYGPEAAAVVLSVMAADPRIPDFFDQDPKSGELIKIDVGKIRESENFNLEVERTLTGWKGKGIPPIHGRSFGGEDFDLSKYSGTTMLIYVWFTNCPPCVKITPELVSVQNIFSNKSFTVVGLNADKLLKLPYDDSYRFEYSEKHGVNFPNLHLTEKLRKDLGNVNIFPTLFLVDGDGTIVDYFVNFQDRDVLGTAIKDAISQ